MKSSKKYLSIFLFILLIFLINNNFAFSKKVINKNTTKPQNLNFEPYNNFPGDQNLDLSKIQIKRGYTSIGVISPDMKKIAYTKVYFYPQNKQTSSRVFYVNTNLDLLENVKVTLSPSELSKIFLINSPANPGKLILESGTDNMDSEIFRTLTIVDWSTDSKKLLVKETTGEHCRGIWATNIWVYDFNIKKAKRLDEVRKAVAYYYKNKYHMYLSDYRWDIVPLGWDANNPDLIIVNAYGYTNAGNKEFLGCWSVDFRGERTRLLSEDEENWQVSKNGLVLHDNK